MPRKNKSDDMEEPVKRRSSSRIAALPKPEPVAKSPSAEKVTPRKRKSLPEDVVEIIETDKEVATTPKKRGRPSKKAATGAEAKPAEPEAAADAAESENHEEAKANSADFEVVNKESLPSPGSEEVKKAVDAQGTDGQLLVNFVQVSKDEIPSPNSEAIKEIAKQQHDNHSPAKKHAVAEELAKEVHVSPGCNGNCGVEADKNNGGVANGMDLTGPNKNGSHETTAEAADAPVA